jgi:hypothetical protein
LPRSEPGVAGLWELADHDVAKPELDLGWALVLGAL